MRHRNIFRLTVITILTLLAATSIVLDVVVANWEATLWWNSAYPKDLWSSREYLARIAHGVLTLYCERWAPDAQPWRRWQFGFKNFGIGHEATAVMESNNKVWRRDYYLHVPLFVLTLSFAVYPFIAFVRGPLRRYRRAKAGGCQKCGYSLVGNVSGVCPECGEETPVSAECH